MDILGSGVRTFIFTELVGSVRLWEQYPHLMPEVAARLATIMQTQAAAHDGHIFKVVDEEYCLAFADPADALRWAVATQRAIRAEDWGIIGNPGLTVAVQTGYAEWRDNDYHGSPTFNRLATAHPGQILLTAAAGADPLPPGYRLRDLGARSLRDLAPEHIYRLATPDLPEVATPIKTLDERPHNLPGQATSFIGREAEVAAVCELLRQPHRLLTMTGPGGTGKTRLSLQVAVSLLDEYSDGVWFVPLAAVRDPAQVAATIVQALGLKDGGDPLALLTDHLRERELLLLLDNFEQVTAAAPLLTNLLAAAPTLKLVVTSRTLLRLPDEQEYRVPPLALPDLDHLPQWEELARYTAPALFVARAQAARYDFTLNPQNAAAVAEICVRLDGLPLAIELAAARSKLYTPQVMVGQLNNRLRLLASNARDLPERQRSLRGALDWSYDLLTEAEQLLFARLSVFVGGCTAEAAAAVGNGDGGLGIDPLVGLASLVEKSLLRLETKATPLAGEVGGGAAKASPLEGEVGGGGVRYLMLETIREYALARLAESGEEERVRGWHADYFVGLAERAGVELRDEHQGAWLNRLDAEYSNIRLALTWLTESNTDITRTQIAARLAIALSDFWQARAYLIEAHSWLQKILSQSEHIAYEQRVSLLSTLGLMARLQGDFAGAETAFTELVNLTRANNDKQHLAVALHNLGMTTHDQCNYKQASDFYQQGLALFKEMDEKRHIAAALNNLGIIAQETGDYAQAAVWHEQSLRVRRERGDKRGIAMSLNNFGIVALFKDDYLQADGLLKEGLALFYELGSKKDIADCLESVAQVAAMREQAARTASILGAAEALREHIGSPMSPSDRIIYDRYLNTARSQLDEPAFTTAWYAGRAMSLDDAVAYALADELAAEYQRIYQQQDNRHNQRKEQHDRLAAVALAVEARAVATPDQPLLTYLVVVLINLPAMLVTHLSLLQPGIHSYVPTIERVYCSKLPHRWQPTFG